MEEQRQRQEDEQRRATAESAQDEAGGSASTVPAVAATSDEAMLERALALSTETPVKRSRVRFVSVLCFFGLIYNQNCLL